MKVLTKTCIWVCVCACVCICLCFSPCSQINTLVTDNNRQRNSHKRNKPSSHSRLSVSCLCFTSFLLSRVFLSHQTASSLNHFSCFCQSLSFFTASNLINTWIFSGISVFWCVFALPLLLHLFLFYLVLWSPHSRHAPLCHHVCQHLLIPGSSFVPCPILKSYHSFPLSHSSSLFSFSSTADQADYLGTMDSSSWSHAKSCPATCWPHSALHTGPGWK